MVTSLIDVEYRNTTITTNYTVLNSTQRIILIIKNFKLFMSHIVVFRLEDKVTAIHRVVKIITAHVLDATCTTAVTVIISDVRVVDARRTSSFI